MRNQSSSINIKAYNEEVDKSINKKPHIIGLHVSEEEYQLYKLASIRSGETSVPKLIRKVMRNYLQHRNYLKQYRKNVKNPHYKHSNKRGLNKLIEEGKCD